LAVAHLIYPARGLLQARLVGVDAFAGRAAHRFPTGGAALWRAIGLGLAFALIGMGMMIGAIGAAGVAAPVVGPRDVVSVVAPTTTGHRLEIYQDPAEALTGALPVP
jgi:hypothetical protein